MPFIQFVLPFIGILIGLVLVHEFGHFVTAKLAGVKVLEFGVGFPPRIAGKRFGETEYTINALPLGGFVKMLGEEDPGDPRSLAAKPRLVRLAVLASGSAMNFLLPFVLFTAAFMIPQEVSTGRTQIVQIMPGSPAEQAGLQAGDVIFAINGRDMRNPADVGRAIRLNLGRELTMRVKHEQDFKDVSVHVRWAPPEGQGWTGIVIQTWQPAFVEKESHNLFTAMRLGARDVFDTLTLFRNEIVSWFKGGEAPQVAGPVGLAQATGEVVKEAGYQRLFVLAALLSINLAIVNMLPLPALDGGRCLFVVIEMLRGGKRIAPEKEGLVHLIGFALLIGAVVVVTYFDILRILGGGSLFR